MTHSGRHNSRPDISRTFYFCTMIKNIKICNISKNHENMLSTFWNNCLKSSIFKNFYDFSWHSGFHNSRTWLLLNLQFFLMIDNCSNYIISKNQNYPFPSCEEIQLILNKKVTFYTIFDRFCLTLTGRNTLNNDQIDLKFDVVVVLTILNRSKRFSLPWKWTDHLQKSPRK